MQDIDLTSTQSLIDRYYEEEKAQRQMEQTLASVTTRLDASDLAMLSIVAKRFRKTREEVAQEVLSSALVDLFARIDGTERKLMARDADESAKSIANEIAEENGVHSIEFKGGAWANHDRTITKLERKKNKQEEEAEAQLERELAKRLEEALSAHQQTPSITQPAEHNESNSAESSNEATSATTETSSDTSEQAAETPTSMFAG